MVARVRGHPRVDVREDLRRTAPHHYVVENRTPGVTHEDMVRAARVINTFGQPGRYYSLTKIYFVSPRASYRWWTEDNHFTDTTLVNRATTELNYGIQNAPGDDQRNRDALRRDRHIVGRRAPHRFRRS